MKQSFKFINLEQGSAEWLSLRRSMITSTDASVIMEKNPWETVEDLYEYKMHLRPGKEVNDAMRRGAALEPVARELACEMIGIEFTPAVIQSYKYPWQGASLDGLSPDFESVLEIKCPNLATHVFACEGGIHAYYMCQMMHQLAVSGAKKAYYFSYNPDHCTQGRMIEVERDEEYIEELIEKEVNFWENHLCKGVPMLSSTSKMNRHFR